MKKITMHNVETGEIIQREMTVDELTQFEIDAVIEATRQKAEAAKAAEKAALLAKLGITAEEAQLLLGGN